MKKRFLLHPFLFSLYPIAALFAENVGQVPAGDVLRGIFIIQVFVLLVLIIFRLLVKDWEKASLLSTGLVLLFFSYGHVYQVSKAWTIGDFVVGRHRYLVPIFISLWVIWALFILRRLAKIPSLSVMLSLSGLIVLVLPGFAILNYYFQPDQSAADPQRLGSNELQLVQDVDLPDIYYIVLDGYGRDDVLSEIYDYDNEGFLSFLRDHGFFVAHNSRSNYVSTALSLASSLNLDYVGNLLPDMDVNSEYRKPLHDLMKSNHVASMLESIGYETIAFETGYPPTVIDNVDIFWGLEADPAAGQFIDTGGILINPFEDMLLRSSGAIVILDASFVAERIGLVKLRDPQYALHRHRVIYNITKLSDVPLLDGDYFVFSHVLSPHPPFVFGESGEPITPDRPYVLADGAGVFLPDEYLSGYRAQLTYLNTILKKTIEEILDRSDPPPIIILQADHGPGAFTDWFSYENTNIRERISILNAYHFPGLDESSLYPEISPVNSFRVLFNHNFGTDFGLLKDKSYYTLWDRPYDYIEIPVE